MLTIGNFSGEVINNIVYADNMSILSPLLKAYKILLTYEQYGKDLDRVSVTSPIALDIFDGMQWRGTELTCTCFLCKS